MSVTIQTGDCLAVMRGMADGSVNCCVTSPPYFGLRDYGHEGQIGLEPTPDAYVARLVEVFREARRVMREDGTLWLNLGDSYNAAGRNGHGTRVGYKQGTNRASATGADACRPSVGTLKEKDLIGIPWRVAFALQADGWYLRQDIIWHKPNPMPESVTDRCTKAHEYVFLLAKRERYYYDHEAVKEAGSEPPQVRPASRMGVKALDGLKSASPNMDRILDGTRNKRSVWTVATRPYAEAHFATFPPDLIRPCILAGCPVGGTVLDPFGGSGTTGMVAEEEGRHSVLIELNPEYVKLAQRRTAQLGLLARSAA
jgi:site-specific DNA-methyltransferase (adenine-specific)